MKKNKKKAKKPKIKRIKISLWRRVNYFVTWYTVKFIISLVIFSLFFNFRLVFRSLDIIFNDALYKNINDIALRLLIESALCLATFAKLVNDTLLFYGALLNVRRIRETEEMLLKGGNSFGFEGEQGVGKTRTMVYAAMLLAAHKSEDLCYKYYSTLPVATKLFQDGKFWEYRRFKAREEAFEFYFDKNKDKIPLLYANVDVQIDKLSPYKLTAKHFTQEERLYENNVKILTEADDLFPNTLRKKKKKTADEPKKGKKGETKESERAPSTPPEDEIDVNAVDKFVGLDRQFTNGTLISDTHANGDVFKSIRNCQSFTLYLTRAEMRYTPQSLKNRAKRLRRKIISVGDDFWTTSKTKSKKRTKLLKKIKRLRRRLKRLEKLMKKISITRIYYRKISGPGQSQSVDKEEFYVLPNNVPYDYDDRMFQTEYKFTPKFGEHG